MNTLFLRALEILLPTLTFTKPITDPATIKALDGHVQSLNSLFASSKGPFLSVIKCPGTFPLPPIVCTSPRQAGRFKYLVFSLNPGLDRDFICDELNAALTPQSLWDTYIDYYVNGTGTPGVYQAIIPGSRYYQNRITLLHALEQCNYEKWSEISGNTRAAKKVFGMNFLNDPGVVFADMIPFHSTSMAAVSLAKLYATIPEYERYHHFLFKEFPKRLADDGTIIVDGELPAATFFAIINTMGGLKSKIEYDCNLHPTTTAGSAVKLSTGCFNNRKVIVFHEFLRRRGGCFNTWEQLSAVTKLLCTSPPSC